MVLRDLLESVDYQGVLLGLHHSGHGQVHRRINQDCYAKYLPTREVGAHELHQKDG